MISKMETSGNIRIIILVIHIEVTIIKNIKELKMFAYEQLLL